MIQKRFPVIFLLGILFWSGVLSTFTWVINPYGVSPINITIDGINKFKPKRLDIDRIIKPYEVWYKQPKTVFMGTSRIHQAIDPTVLDRTRFAPAYNASIPASTLSENAAHLEQFFWLNPNIKQVFVEVFLYNFIAVQSTAPRMTLSDLAQNTAPLLFSGDAIWDSLKTIIVNRFGDKSGATVTASGHWVPPRGQKTKDTFNPRLHIDYIMRIHRTIPGMAIQPSAIKALDRIVELCRKNGAELYLIDLPNHPWDDYRLLSIGYWHLVERFYRMLANYPNFISFSQYNVMLTEPAGANMRWWYDPDHPSRTMGDAILHAFIGRSDTGTPTNLMQRVTPETVETVVRERLDGLQAWAAQNPQYTNAFDEAKFANGVDRSQIIR